MESQNRIVVVLNEKVEAGRVVNAAAHLALGFGASRGPQAAIGIHLLDYVDGSGVVHGNISALSLVVLKANPNQLSTLRGRALEAGLPYMDFTSTMTEGTYAEQLERTRATATDQLVYYGILLFGTREQLDPLTRKFSLFK